MKSSTSLSSCRAAIVVLLLGAMPLAARAGGPHVIARHAPGPVAMHHHGGMSAGVRQGFAWQNSASHRGGWNGWNGACWNGPAWNGCCWNRCYGPRWGCAPVTYFGGWYQPWNYFGWIGVSGTNIFSVQPFMMGPWNGGAVPGPFGVVQADFAWEDQVVDVQPVRPAAAVARVDDDRPRLRSTSREPVVASTAAGRQRAGRSLEQGDELFARGRYLEALQKYKTAASFASDQGEPYLRQTLAYIAAEKYDRAAASLRRGLTIDPQLARSGFRIDSLYGAERATKETHLEAMAQAALERPRNADILFLIGAFLHYDGEVERADRFLAQAARLMPPGESAEIGLFRPETAPVPSVARSRWQ